jgi:hypothetical protein
MVTLGGVSSTFPFSDTAGKCGTGCTQRVAGDRPAAPKEATMRIRMGLVLGLLLVVTVAGCGKRSSVPGVVTAHSGAAASASATSTLSQQEKALKFAQCMRDNGVPNFKDPKVDENGGIGIDAPDGADPAKIDAAMQKCRQYLPGGGQPQKADPQVTEQLRKYAQCMRDNGFPTFPDPNADGGLAIDPSKLGITGKPEDDPKYRAADQKCQQYKPTPPPGGGGGGTTTNTEGN